MNLKRICQTKSSESRAPTSYCASSDCGKDTRHQKPYCVEHILDSKYPSLLVNLMEGRVKEIENVREIGVEAIKEGSLVIKDILVSLQTEGTKSIAKLARDDANIPKEIAEHYITKMVKMNLVSIKKLGRSDGKAGKWMVTAKNI